MAIVLPKDPRFRSLYHLKRKAATEIELKRVKWDHGTDPTSFAEGDKSITKKMKPESNNIYTITSPKRLDSHVRRDWAESKAPASYGTPGREKSNVVSVARPTLFFTEYFCKSNTSISIPEPKMKEVLKDDKKIKILEKQPTLLENYLMRIHELVRLSVDELYVQKECKKLLTNVVKKVSFQYEEECSERSL